MTFETTGRRGAASGIRRAISRSRGTAGSIIAVWKACAVCRRRLATPRPASLEGRHPVGRLARPARRPCIAGAVRGGERELRRTALRPGEQVPDLSAGSGHGEHGAGGQCIDERAPARRPRVSALPAAGCRPGRRRRTRRGCSRPRPTARIPHFGEQARRARTRRRTAPGERRRCGRARPGRLLLAPAAPAEGAAQIERRRPRCGGRLGRAVRPQQLAEVAPERRRQVAGAAVDRVAERRLRPVEPARHPSVVLAEPGQQERNAALPAPAPRSCSGAGSRSRAAGAAPPPRRVIGGQTDCQPVAQRRRGRRAGCARRPRDAGSAPAAAPAPAPGGRRRRPPAISPSGAAGAVLCERRRQPPAAAASAGPLRAERQQELPGVPRLRRRRRGRGGALLQHHVSVGAADAERVDARPPRPARGRPIERSRVLT